MKILPLLAVILFSLGCNNGGGSNPTSPTQPPTTTQNQNNVPGISNLQYSPKTATVGQGGGVVTMSGSFDFIDADSDVTTFSVNYNGTISTAAATNTSGTTVGTLAVVAGVNTGTAGSYSFQVWVTDSKNNISNKLTGTFTVSTSQPATDYTSQIKDYLSTKHTSAISDFATYKQTTDEKMNSTGMYGSRAHVDLLIEMFTYYIQDFVDKSRQYAASHTPYDKNTISQSFTTYRESDISYAKTTIMGDLTTKITSIYSFSL